MERVRVYTDGSAKGNPGPGGYGVLLFLPNAAPRSLQAGYRLSTNNRMELQAVIAALEALPEKNMQVDIYTDSKYVVNSVEKGWLKNWVAKHFRKVKNADLWKSYIQVAEKQQPRFLWLPGHSGHSENELCDRLAREAADQPTRIDAPYERIFLATRASRDIFEKES